MKSEDQSGLETKCLDSDSNLGATTTEKLEGTSGWEDTDPLPFPPPYPPGLPSFRHSCFIRSLPYSWLFPFSPKYSYDVLP